MAARSGMGTLIQELRLMSDAGTADYTAGTVTYWSDDHLQNILDRHRVNLYQEELEPWPSIDTDSTPIYQEYRASRGNLESGTAAFVLQDTIGGTAPTNTIDYNLGIVTFTDDQAGTAYMLTARSYDLNASAAEVWRNKASNAAKYFDFRTDNHQVSKSQFVKQCLDMAKYYGDLSETQSFAVTEIYRSDVAAGGNDD